MYCKFRLLTLIIVVLIAGCSESKNTVDGRWYTESQISVGEKLFQNSCAACHGAAAQGTFNWRKRLADGSFPPPPLNGTAHTWHHPMGALKSTILNGGIAQGGKMPPFKNVLSDEEIESVIAFFQNKWNSQVYDSWSKRN